MDYSLQHHESFIGSPVSELPTPAFVVRKRVIEDNIAQLHRDVDDLNIVFRPHVKTLKVYSPCLGTRRRYDDITNVEPSVDTGNYEVDAG